MLFLLLLCLAIMAWLAKSKFGLLVRALREDQDAAGLSKMLAEEVYEMLTVLTSRDSLTILIVDQEIRQALKIADYVYVLELGRNKFEGAASEFQDLEKGFWVGWARRRVQTE